MHFSPATLYAFLTESLSPADLRGIEVNSVAEGAVELSLRIAEDQLSRDLPRGSGKTVVSGPLMLGFGDTAMYAAVHAALGSNVFAAILNMNTSFFRLAEPTTLIAHAKVMEKGRSVCFTDALIYSEGEEQPCVQITASYAIKRLAGEGTAG